MASKKEEAKGKEEILENQSNIEDIIKQNEKKSKIKKEKKIEEDNTQKEEKVVEEKIKAKRPKKVEENKIEKEEKIAEEKPKTKEEKKVEEDNIKKEEEIVKEGKIMLSITIPECEQWDAINNEFISTKETTLQLEHSLISSKHNANCIHIFIEHPKLFNSSST